MLSLASRLRTATKDAHTRAERTGIVSDLLNGRASVERYTQYLRNLHVVYSQLEESVKNVDENSPVRWFGDAGLARSPRIANDLDQLAGEHWRQQLELKSAAGHYRDRIEHAASLDPLSLVAHCYVRYLGDLSGGQVVSRMLTDKLQIDSGALSFYRFPGIDDIESFKASFRTQIDTIGDSVSESGDSPEFIITTAVEAFELNIALSQSV